MTYIKAIDPSEAQGTVKKAYDEVQAAYGVVPTFLRVLGLRPDVLEASWDFGKRLMEEEHALSRATKALIASYVSKVNSCAY
jgi:hypothetical protein